LPARSRLRTYVVRFSHQGPRAVIAAGALGVCLLLGLGLGPFTPLALDRAERALLEDGPVSALEGCEQVGRWGLLGSWRARADYRAATLYARQLDQPSQAVSRLRTLLQQGEADPALEALALQLLAESLEARSKHRLAAERYEQLTRQVEDPSPWLQAAARAWERAGRLDRALLRHAALTVHPSPRSTQAYLAMGRISLGQGRTDKGYDYYAAALEAQPNLEQARLARLGMALALDDMGQFEQALAELDEASAGGDVAIDITRDRLQRRAAEGQSTP